MAQQTVKKISYDNHEVAVEVAKRDYSGNIITTTYATKVENSAKLDTTTFSTYTGTTAPATYVAIENFKINYLDANNVAYKSELPTKTSDLQNDSGFLTEITSGDVTTALGYTPENQSNKVTLVTALSTDTEYPSAKCVYKNIENVTAIAEGKTKTYVINTAKTVDTSAYSSYRKADGSAFNSANELSNYINGLTNDNSALASSNDQIGLLGLNHYLIINTGSIAGWTIYKNTAQINDTSHFKLGDVLLIVQTDYPDRWVSAVSLSGLFVNKLESTKVDLGWSQIGTPSDPKPNFSTVATTGSYNDLLNKPTIPTATSQLTNDSGFITSSYHDSTKQDVLTAGNGITISNNTISSVITATDITLDY